MKKSNERVAREKGIRVWTGKEISESELDDDTNFKELDSIGKPSPWYSKSWISTTSTKQDKKYVLISDLKVMS